MKKFIPFVTLFLQMLAAYIILSGVYIVYALMDFDYDGIVSGISFLIFQPLLGFFLISITVMLCLVLGLPIRLKGRFKQWWLSKPVIPLFGVAIGLMFMILAFFPALTKTIQVSVDGIVSKKQVPNTILAICGWFLIGFCILHFYPRSMMFLIRRNKTSV